jgi:uncharacterized YigZ family protein
MADSYHTIKKKGESLLKEKGSKFFGYAFKVRSEDAVTACLDELKKKHHSARHFCYAYRIGPEGERYRSNDDGEPSHSAGDPILRHLQGKELTFTLVVVVRYFGGTKLGVGGLIQAYGETAQLAIEDSGIKEVERTQWFKVEFAYAQMSEVMRLLKKYELDMEEHDFNITCSLEAEVPLRVEAEFMEDLNAIPFIKVSLETQ